MTKRINIPHRIDTYGAGVAISKAATPIAAKPDAANTLENSDFISTPAAGSYV